ncbi:MAG: class I SAM-dependent methyltransferase [Candidatus Competibacteraceae bacterium]|nr:class I SAM-dependent methyltransferase [Candidatus Competibacteraceae bacterium]
MPDLNFHPIENSGPTAKVVVPLLSEWYQPSSVLDLGTNVGWWLKFFIDCGVKDVLGVDGSNMVEHLQIPRENFREIDLRADWSLGRRFDLVLCLEVAEHILPESADGLVGRISGHTDRVFWCAAVPNQGGWEHLNEQPAEYWTAKFEARGFARKE